MSVVFLSWCGVSPVVRRSSKQPWILWCVQVQISPFPVSCRWAFHCHHRYSSLVPNYAVWKLPWSEQALFVSSLPSRICSYIDIICILESLDACRICIGNSEEKFFSVVRHRNSTPKGECLDVTIIYYYNNYYVNVYFYIGQDTGVLEAQITSTLTVRHKECQLIVPSASTSVRCAACVRHRASLSVQHLRLQNSSENVQSSSSVNYHYLSMPQLVTRLQSIHHDNRLLSKQCKRLTQKLEEDCRRRGVDVDDATHDDLMEIVKQQWVVSTVAYEKALSGDQEPPSLAKSMLVFMVRGLFTKLQFAYAQFPSSSLAGEKLFKPFWDAVCRIETCGLKVSEYL